MPIPTLPPIPSISEITDRAWRMVGPVVAVGEDTAGRAIDFGRRGIAPVIELGERQAGPIVDGGGRVIERGIEEGSRILDAGSRVLEPIVDAGGRIIGRAIDSGERQLRGIGSETAELAEQIVRRLMQVTNESLDFIVDRVRQSATRTMGLVEDIVRDSAIQIDREVESAFNLAENVAMEIANLPAEALELLGSGEEVLLRARDRSASIRRYVERFRARRRSLPRLVAERVEHLSIEIEEELEADAVAAEELGQRVYDDSRRLFERTVEDAQRFGGILLRQTEETRRRGVELKGSITDGVHAVRSWADERINRIIHFGQDRIRAGLAIRTPADAERWSSDAISAVFNVASEIENEALTRPEEIMNFGRRRVADAASLAFGVATQVATAYEWLQRQKGHNAEWRQNMASNRNMARDFFLGQLDRMETRVRNHGEIVITTARDLGFEQFDDTFAEVRGISTDIQTTAFEHGQSVWRETTGFRTLFDETPILNSPPTVKNRELPTIEVPTRSNSTQGMAEPLGEASVEAPEQVHVNRARNSNESDIVNQGAPRTGPNRSQPSAQSRAPLNQTPDPRSNTSAGQERSNSTTPTTTTHLPSNAEAASSPRSNVASPKSVPETSHQSKVPVKAEANNASPPPIESQKVNTGEASAKPKTKPAAAPKPESQVPKGIKVPPLPKKEKPTRQEPVSGQKPGQAAATQGPEANKPKPKPSEQPSQAKPKPVAGAAKDKDKAAEVAKPPAASNTSVPKVAERKESQKLPALTKAGAAGIQKKKAEREEPSDAGDFKSKIVQAGGEGQAPDSTTRSELTPHLGFDPYMMRFHTGPAAQAAAKSLSADAFTIGTDVFFAEGKFDPRSPSGMGLIGHEATHVGQQLGLTGNKMRFHTKTGGDAMEQEAQEVGERIASNLSYGQGLRVSKYIRTYEPADDEAITPRVQIRLDRLSMQALTRAGEILSQRPRPQPIRLDEVEVDFHVDLEEFTGAEITEMWAQAIVAAVESARPTSLSNIHSEEVLAPATHVLQKKLGDPAQEPAAEPPPKIDPEVMARILKITPNAQDKDMIRKLLVREHVDDMISASKRKQLQDEYENSGADIGSISGAGSMPRYSGNIHDSDRAGIEAKLKEYDINSYEDFVKLKTDFVSAFEKKGVNIVTYMLEENLKIVLEQKKKYLSRDAKDPDAPINSIRKSAEAVKKAMDGYIDALNRMDVVVWMRIGAHSNKPTYGNLDSVTDTINQAKIHPDYLQHLKGPYENFMKVRQSHGDKHPLLLSRDFNPDTILDEKDAGELELKLFHHFEGVEKDIRYAKGEMSPSKFWELHPMIELTRKQLGVREGEGAAKTLDEFQKKKANDEKFWSILQAAAAIALAVTAMVATGGLAAVAMVGSAGLSVYSAAKAADDYMFKSAAVNSSLDQAKLISKDEPSLLWLAIELIGAGLDVGAAVGAFGKLAKIAKTAVSDKAALKELEETARQAYRESKIVNVAEDDFVARLLETAKKGVNGVEDMVKQAKLATELLEGTSARAVAIMKGDRVAIQSLVTEYGNWKGLMGSLTNGGEDAAKMSKNIGAWRNEIVADLKARGAAPLEDASMEVVSDFDLNVVAKGDKGAGERLIEFEAEMAGKYGPKWSESLLMNFYTDKSQLMKVEDALKMVSPQKRAQIMARVTEKSEKLNFAKMLEHAGDDPAAIKQVEELMQAAGVKHSVDELKAVAKEAHAKGRDNLLLDIDKKIAEMEKLPANHPSRAAKAEEITELQMEANFLTREAYISPAAVKGGPLTNAEAYTNALSQLEMIRHVIHDCGGDILKACREYELFKYINRYTAAAQKAGIKSPGLTYFEGLSAYVYKRARSANMETGHLPGVTPADEAMEAAVDGKYLLDQYNQFRQEVDKTLPQLREAAQKNPAGGWKPEMKSPKPNSGLGPAPSKPATTVEGPKNLYTPPPMDPAKAAGLPAAAVKTVEAAQKAADGKGAKNEGIIGPQSAVTSAGFGASAPYQGIGMFRTRIPGVKNEVLVTVMPADKRSQFEQQMAAAMAAAKTGIGPKFHGKVEMGEKKLAFAIDSVEGGYADAYNNKIEDESDKAMARGDMMRNAQNITPQTFQDLDVFRNSIFESGFYYVGPVDGFVTPDGRWKPVNFYNATAMSQDTVIDAARSNHDLQFDNLRHKLMENHMKAKQEAKK